MENKYVDIFYESDVQPLLQEQLHKLEIEFQQNRYLLRNQFIQNGKQILQQINLIQSTQEFTTGYVMFHLLRNRILNHDYRYQINIYPKEWYMNEGVSIGDLDVSFAFNHFETLWNRLLTEHRKYIGKLTEVDVEKIMLRLIEYFHSYVVELLRYSIIDLVESKEFIALIKEDLFYIRAGEFFEPGDVIFKEDVNKNLVKIKEWLKAEDKGNLVFSDFQNLNLSKLELNKTDLRYVDFRKCNLKETDFSLAILQGAKFRDADLRDAKFNISYLSGVDFKRADLTGTQFMSCIGYVSKNPMNEWKKTGFTETSFEDCNLTNASFRGAVLQGANFKGAIIHNTDFEEANLYQSRFTKEGLENCHFTKEQIEQIIVE